jgi:hypothetical protein
VMNAQATNAAAERNQSNRPTPDMKHLHVIIRRRNI